MNADIVCWGCDKMTTEVDVKGESESIFFKDDTSGYLRIFMSPIQMQLLKSQLEAALAESTPETATVQT